MVLFKRKPVQFLTIPDIQDDHVEVWHIPQTGEIFTTYEDYLNRMDFYKQKRFICQISGKSGLTFFDALKSEVTPNHTCLLLPAANRPKFAGAAEVEQAFPEALKGPVLRKVQFQTTSRIDALVDRIYDEFKNDYYPGETVTITDDNGERFKGTVRQKAQFGSKLLPDGTLAPPYAQYIVSLDELPGAAEKIVNDTNIFRDRKIFTKMVLRSFIRKTVSRASWNGAPWIVKEDLAQFYNIDTRVPPHLLYDNKLLERKQLQAQKRHSHDANGHAPDSFSPDAPVRLPELKPAPKSHKAKHLQQDGGAGKGKNAFQVEGGFSMHITPGGGPYQYPVALREHLNTPPVVAEPLPPPPPPPPKYPIEDLQLEPRDRVRPKLKYLCADPPVEVEDKKTLHDKIHMKSIGPLLETWDTLNVYCEIFKLDSFTFDDFVEALLVASEDVPCQIFDEIHCAVLKILVSSEADGGKVQIQLPELDDDEEEEEESVQDSAQPSPEPEPEPSGRTTRRSLAKMEADRLAAEVAAAEKAMQQAVDLPKHHAEEVLQDFDWIEQLRKRNFKDGGWQLIMVGLLHQLSKKERQRAVCDELLEQLVPRDVEATQETVKQHYDRLDINYRVKALQIICMLTAETKAVRGYMEDCSETMTSYRKEKIEWQRKRKQYIEELKALNEERKILLPDNLPPSPPLEPTKTADNDVKMDDVEDITADLSDGAVDTDDDVQSGGRGLRRAQDRAAERKRKLEKEQERKEKAEAAAKIPKQSKQFLKILKDIQKKEDEIKKCEEEIAVIDNDLREADCPRTRVLGKDRFWNRYYWFERNGMPYGGLPDSSTASAGYANGLIWVQGPDELEREGYIDMIPEYQEEYKAKFNLTVPERKLKEEGPTHVFNAHQWGYFSDPSDVDGLLDWLDSRGFNELKLRKEIVNYRDKIIKNMENRKEYLKTAEEKAAETAASTEAQADQEEEDDSPKRHGKGSKRMSTRGARSAAQTATPEPARPAFRCLAWENTTALEELGHLHSEQPPPPKTKGSRKKGGARESNVSAVDVVAEPVTTRSGKKKGGRNAAL
ncbi:ATP-utilizing chromatin assembly and remodelling N-terminal-domain-containing protein [Coniochaeta sp. 2T2.1]|nr:ATP-utilizing chromatin assembly and remodelling N-terminal-domain-containing protein [Coniochaeta sp. 2T2.1]